VAATIARRLWPVKLPAILVDQDMDRYGAAGEVLGLAEKLLADAARERA
jgi:hypothetical protein